MWEPRRLSSCLIRLSVAMRWLLYLRLFYLTAGTLLPFFWMVVILGHRRQRDFERIFFFLCLALVCFFGSSLLALNAQLYYSNPPHALMRFAWTWLCLGLWFLPPLVLHTHAEYAALRGLFRTGRGKTFWLAVAYLPTLPLLPKLIAALRTGENLNFERPTYLLVTLGKVSAKLRYPQLLLRARACGNVKNLSLLAATLSPAGVLRS